MRIHHKKLKSRGWTEHEIKKAHSILKKAEKEKHPHNRALEHISYYICLFVALAGNFIISILLIPLLLAFNSLTLYVLTIIIGLCFGILFTVLVRDLIHLQSYHKFVYFLVPIVALINITIVVEKYNGLSIIAGNIEHNPLALGIVYALAFIAPYIYFMVEGETWI